jgi:predicted RNA binding protein YcfA (HicA-like mRNA interferase family)
MRPSLGERVRWFFSLGGSMPSDWRFADVQKLLESNGWTLDRITSSHHIFTGQGRPMVSIPVHRGKVKFAYVRKIQRAVEDLEEDGEGQSR